MALGFGLGLGFQRGGSGAQPYEAGSVLLLQSGADKLLLEGGTDAILLEGNK